jgi:hypothetical protein
VIWLLDEVDGLYHSVVSDPESWIEQRFIDWSDSVSAGGEIDRDLAKHLRRILATARKLGRFWRDHADRPDLAWRSKVDLAFGPRAWRPVMDLAMVLLESDPSEELFDRAGELFRIVNNQPYLDGIDYENWSEHHTRSM